MKNILGTTLVLCGFVFAGACSGEAKPSPVPPPPSNPADDYLANAPLGGAYVGNAYMLDDTCSGGPVVDEPIRIQFDWYPLNPEQTSFDGQIGQVEFTKIEPVSATENDRQWYEVKHEQLNEYKYDGVVVIKHLTGTLERGVMRLLYVYEQYEGTKEARGKKLCEGSFDLRLAKVVNYPYVERVKIDASHFVSPVLVAAK